MAQGVGVAQGVCVASKARAAVLSDGALQDTSLHYGHFYDGPLQDGAEFVESPQKNQ